MNEADLAALARTKRKEERLTQTDLANLLVDSGRYGHLSKQAISKAENYAPGDGMTGLRVAIVEELMGRHLAGPLWTFADEIEEG